MDHLTAWRDEEGGARALRQDLTPAWESRFQHRRALPVRTQPRVGDPDLNDPQILLLELAHGMLIGTETYIVLRSRPPGWGAWMDAGMTDPLRIRTGQWSVGR
jgi:hypothetical protein